MQGVQREPQYQSHKGVIELDGIFWPDTASNPSDIIGNWIDSVAHSATGVWTITMKEKYRGHIGLLGCQVSLSMNALGLSIIQFGAIDLAAGTIIIRAATESGGTLAAADIAANANNFIAVKLVLKFEKSQDGSGLV